MKIILASSVTYQMNGHHASEHVLRFHVSTELLLAYAGKQAAVLTLDSIDSLWILFIINWNVQERVNYFHLEVSHRLAATKNP